MAIFKSKNEKEEKVSAKKPVKQVKAEKVLDTKVLDTTKEAFTMPVSSVLLRPRITEKASIKAETGVYAFDVVPSATKGEISAAIFATFKVQPVKIAIVPVRRKKVISRGKKGFSRGGKKAYVYLKKGETIEFV